MTRYYYRDDISTSPRYRRPGSVRIDEILNNLYVLIVDEDRKHHFVSAASEAHAHRWGWKWEGDKPFVFETPEHEREFLDYHPDAKDLRSFYSHYHRHCFACSLAAIDYEELPIFKKGNRWFWKK